jgi:hypothetical protein
MQTTGEKSNGTKRNKYIRIEEKTTKKYVWNFGDYLPQKIIDIPCMECCKNDTIMQKISSYLQICHNATCTRPYIVTGTVLLLNNHNCKQNRFYQNHRHMIDNMEGCMLAFLATEAMINTGRYQ